MVNKTRSFKNHPSNFLSNQPLLISIPPGKNFESQIVYFDINTSEYVTNSTLSMLENDVCELIETKDTNKIKAYWLPYKEDNATSLQLGSDADFMFTADMSGCTFAATESEGSPKVSHSNAAKIGGIINQYLENSLKSSLAQKAIQQVAAKQVLGGENIKYQNSLSQHCTTTIGVRDITTGSWRFYKQVIETSDYGSKCTVKSVTSF